MADYNIIIDGAFVSTTDIPVSKNHFLNPRADTTFEFDEPNDTFIFFWNTYEPLQARDRRVLGTETYIYSDLVDVIETINGVPTVIPIANARSLESYLKNKVAVELTQVLESPTTPTQYFKAEVEITAVSNNFNSNTPSDVPGLTYTIGMGENGDYVFYSVINGKNEQNEEADMYFALNSVTIIESVVTVRMQKKQDHSIQNTYPLDGLVAGDIITVQLNTRGDNVDLETRRILIQSWNLV